MCRGGVNHAGVTYTPLFDITSPSPSTCLSPWTYDAVANACVAPSGPACHSVVRKPVLHYRYIRGEVEGVQFGAVCAFGPANRTNSLNGASTWRHRCDVDAVFVVAWVVVVDGVGTVAADCWRSRV